MSLSTVIEKDYKQALTSRNQERVDLLRLIKSALKNESINLKKPELSDDEVVKILKKESKKRLDSIELYQKGDRQDLANKEQQELDIIKQYLPSEMSQDEIKKIVAETISAMPDSGPGQFGTVMKVVMSKLQGKADGKMVSKAVKEILG